MFSFQKNTKKLKLKDKIKNNLYSHVLDSPTKKQDKTNVVSGTPKDKITIELSRKNVINKLLNKQVLKMFKYVFKSL